MTRLSLSVLLALNFTFSMDSQAQQRRGTQGRKNPGSFQGRNFDVIVERSHLQGGMKTSECYEKFVNQIDTKKRSIDKKEFESCELGFREGAKMAERVGRGQGQTLGRIHGLSKGMDEGYNSAASDPAEIAAGRQSVSELDFESAKLRGAKAAEPLAEQAASADAYNRFRTAVNNQAQPDSAVSFTVPSYSGFNDGYTYDSKPVLDEEAIFRQEFRKQTNPYQFSHDDFFEAREVSELNSMDYWRVRGFRGNPRDVDSRFSSWRNQSSAFSNFVNGQTGSIYRYIGSGTRTEYQVKTITPTPAPSPAPTPAPQVPNQPAGGRGGQGGGRPDGNGPRPVPPAPPVVVPTPTPSQPQTEVVPVVINVPDTHYKTIFEDSFKRAYSMAIEKAFATNYYVALDDAYPKGFYIGEAVGLEVAYQAGIVQEYNYRYQKESVSAYRDRYKEVYESTFINKFNARKAGTFPEVEGLEIAGSVNDGIFRAGEKVAAQLTIANYGGKAKKVTISLYGDLAGESQTMEYNLPALKRVTVTTPYLAQIALNKNPREAARLGARVDEIARNINLEVNNIVEIRGVNVTEFNPVAGTAQVVVQLLNPSTATNPQSHTLSLAISGHPTKSTETVEALKGGEAKSIQFNLTGLDPLMLINKGLVVSSDSTMGNDKLDSGTARRFTSNKTGDLTKYYDQLVLSTENLAKATVPAGTDLKLRLADVQNLILGEIKTQLADANYVDANPWKKAPDTTYVGNLSKNFTLQQPKTPGYTAYYQGLGAVLWQMRLTFDENSILKQARSSYGDLVQTFSKNEGKSKK